MKQPQRCAAPGLHWAAPVSVLGSRTLAATHLRQIAIAHPVRQIPNAIERALLAEDKRRQGGQKYVGRLRRYQDRTKQLLSWHEPLLGGKLCESCCIGWILQQLWKVLNREDSRLPKVRGSHCTRVQRPARVIDHVTDSFSPCPMRRVFPCKIRMCSRFKNGIRARSCQRPGLRASAFLLMSRSQNGANLCHGSLP